MRLCLDDQVGRERSQNRALGAARTLWCVRVDTLRKLLAFTHWQPGAFQPYRSDKSSLQHARSYTCHYTSLSCCRSHSAGKGLALIYFYDAVLAAIGLRILVYVQSWFMHSPKKLKFLHSPWFQTITNSERTLFLKLPKREDYYAQNRYERESDGASNVNSVETLHERR